ncbi:transposable element Tcb1 transposase [Trichonephila clavipes]|nr:transposable element Tcb1 transposase [Trichonephila clavipes]
MLTTVHRRRRLEFARQYSSWTSTEWRQVAFSDESRFMVHRTDGRWRIRREEPPCNHCRNGPSWRREHYGLGNVFLAFSGFTDHCGRHDGSIQVHICPHGPCPLLHAHCFFLRMMASSSRTMRDAIQLPVYVRGSKSTRMNFPSSLGSKLT